MPCNKRRTYISPVRRPSWLCAIRLRENPMAAEGAKAMTKAISGGLERLGGAPCRITIPRAQQNGTLLTA